MALIGKPAKACPLCNKYQGMTVEHCAECHDRFCLKHISWDPGRERWLCDGCLRRLYGLKRAAAIQKARIA